MYIHILVIHNAPWWLTISCLLRSLIQSLQQIYSGFSIFATNNLNTYPIGWVDLRNEVESETPLRLWKLIKEYSIHSSAPFSKNSHQWTTTLQNGSVTLSALLFPCPHCHSLPPSLRRSLNTTKWMCAILTNLTNTRCGGWWSRCPRLLWIEYPLFYKNIESIAGPIERCTTAFIAQSLYCAKV